jgi:hypothetical protein
MDAGHHQTTFTLYNGVAKVVADIGASVDHLRRASTSLAAVGNTSREPSTSLSNIPHTKIVRVPLRQIEPDRVFTTR